MPYDPLQPQEKKSVFGVIMHSFFVVPFLLAVFSVLLFAAVRILTMEKRSVYDYLADVKSGGATKRWQAAFELSRILANHEAVPTDTKFVDEMSAAYQASSHDDERVKQYLAMAMARTGDERFIGPLLKNITEEKDENLYAIITSLGILRANQAVPVLLKYANDGHPRIRLAAVIALGHIADPSTVGVLQHKLEDSEPNVAWDAAIALAKMGDKSGKAIILKLLDRTYLNGMTTIDPRQKSRIMQVAIEATGSWSDPEIQRALHTLSTTDQNMNVRNAAYKHLKP